VHEMDGPRRGDDTTAATRRARLRAVSAGRRLIIVAIVGVIAGAGVAFVAPWQLAVLAGWVAAGATLVLWVWASVAPLNSEQTRQLAMREDDSRVAADLLLVSASIASLIGTVFDLVKSSQAHGAGKVVLTIGAVATVAVSWAVVHTVYALRYARQFYSPPIGGIDFKSHGEQPDFHDFAYVAFTVGMTFQVSDTDVQSRAIRRTVLRHSLLAYLFGAVILAVTINIVASLLQIG
jgi:uncharacterized membrane protein